MKYLELTPRLWLARPLLVSLIVTGAIYEGPFGALSWLCLAMWWEYCFRFRGQQSFGVFHREGNVWMTIHNDGVRTTFDLNDGTGDEVIELIEHYMDEAAEWRKSQCSDQPES